MSENPPTPNENTAAADENGELLDLTDSVLNLILGQLHGHLAAIIQGVAVMRKIPNCEALLPSALIAAGIALAVRDVPGGIETLIAGSKLSPQGHDFLHPLLTRSVLSGVRCYLDAKKSEEEDRAKDDAVMN